MLTICEEHWELCIKSIEERGLWHLVPDTQEEMCLKLSSNNPRDYDPLINLTMLICQSFVDHFGYEKAKDSEGYCPLCDAQKETGDIKIPEQWIQKV